VAEINARRIALDESPTTAFQIGLQFVHRIGAVLVLLLGARAVWKLAKTKNAPRALIRASAVWLSLILLQIALGIWTIWSRKAADVATTHMVLGAILVTFSTLLVLAAKRVTGVKGTAA
jgi:cytochrome c oxidase assembly protein subunit 15